MSLSLLLRRGDDLPDQLEARIGQNSFALFAFGDEYYEQLALADPASALAHGIAAETLAPPLVRWARGGRTVHVLAPHSSVAGFVTGARIQIGVENVILCATDVAEGVRAFAAEAGASDFVPIGGPGLPAGWTCFRGVRPTSPQRRQPPDPALQPLVPVPSAAILFENGIPMAPGTWLEGRPPRIAVVGQAPQPGDVAIDGKPAVEVTSAWQAPGWDLPGEHRVSFLGVSRSYRIGAAAEHAWPSEDLTFRVRGAMLSSSSGTAAIALDGYECVIGAAPGAIAPFTNGVALPAFAPVWAVAGRRRRKLTRVAPLLLGEARWPQTSSAAAGQRDVRNWCSAIRGVHRDALASPLDPATRRLWQLYVARAQQCWRSSR